MGLRLEPAAERLRVVADHLCSWAQGTDAEAALFMDGVRANRDTWWCSGCRLGGWDEKPAEHDGHRLGWIRRGVAEIGWTLYALAERLAPTPRVKFP